MPEFIIPIIYVFLGIAVLNFAGVFVTGFRLLVMEGEKQEKAFEFCLGTSLFCVILIFLTGSVLYCIFGAK